MAQVTSGLTALLILLTALAACTSAPPVTPPPAQTAAPAVDARGAAAPSVGQRISQQALAMLGVAYRYGGDQPDTGFDCSGLVHFAYSMNGLVVPRTSQEQFRTARKIALGDIAQGDVLFFQDQAKLSHVGIYVGDGAFVHAPSSGKAVSLARIDDPYYQRNLVAVGRLILSGS